MVGAHSSLRSEEGEVQGKIRNVLAKKETIPKSFPCLQECERFHQKGQGIPGKERKETQKIAEEEIMSTTQKKKESRIKKKKGIVCNHLGEPDFNPFAPSRQGSCLRETGKKGLRKGGSGTPLKREGKSVDRDRGQSD